MADGDERRYPRHPLVGVGAILLDRDGGAVLLVQRGSPPSRGSWTFPGGLVEGGEPLRAACRREVREETGLRAELRDVARIVERIVADAAGRAEYHYLIVDFWGVATGGELRAASDVLEARWVPVDEVTRLPTTRGVDEALGRALALARGERPPGPVYEE